VPFQLFDVGVVLAVLLMLVFASAVSWPWIIVGFLVRTPESVMTTSFLLLCPMTFVSDIFVDPRDDARMASVGRCGEPGHAPRRGVARPDARRRGDGGHRHRARDLGRTTAVFAPIAMRMYYKER